MGGRCLAKGNTSRVAVGEKSTCCRSIPIALWDSQGVGAQTAFAACSGVLFHSGFGGQLLNLRLGENGVGQAQGAPPKPPLA